MRAGSDLPDAILGLKAATPGRHPLGAAHGHRPTRQGSPALPIVESANRHRRGRSRWLAVLAGRRQDPGAPAFQDA
jgi:hypothetical protein